jgi:hypothetical protein
MRRIGLRPGLLAVVLAALVAACGSSTSTSTSISTGSAPTGAGASGSTSTTSSTTSATGGLTVSPARAAPNGQVTFGFTPPRSAGVHGAVELSYVLSVTGPQHTGCVGTHSAGTPRAAQGQMTRVALGPTQLGSSWCAGAYTARAEELQRPACKTGQMCPMYVRIVGIVGTAAFRIVARGG